VIDYTVDFNARQLLVYKNKQPVAILNLSPEVKILWPVVLLRAWGDSAMIMPSGIHHHTSKTNKLVNLNTWAISLH